MFEFNVTVMYNMLLFCFSYGLFTVYLPLLLINISSRPNRWAQRAQIHYYLILSTILDSIMSPITGIDGSPDSSSGL